MASTPTNYRINQLAKDLGVKSKDILEVFENKGGEKTHMAVLEPDEFEFLIMKLTEKKQVKSIDDYLSGKVVIETPEEKAARLAAEKAAAEKAAAEKAAAEKAAALEKQQADDLGHCLDNTHTHSQGSQTIAMIVRIQQCDLIREQIAHHHVCQIDKIRQFNLCRLLFRRDKEIQEEE